MRRLAALAALLALGGCLIAYDYGDYVAQGAGGGGATASSATTGSGEPCGVGGGAEACQDCAAQACAGEIEACDTALVKTCSSWLECTRACCDGQCHRTCDAQHENALKKAVYQCMCGACAEACGPVADPCAAD